MPHSLRTAVLFLGALAAGCGNAGVTVAFDHVQGAVALGLEAPPEQPGATPAVFGVKIVAMYLAEDVGSDMNNIGDVQRIWTNPACDADGTYCSIAPSSGQYQVQDYFDLALPSEVVNANLNSQEATVKPGSYRYLRFDMAGVLPLGENNVAPNLRFGESASDASEVRFRGNNYTILLDPPLTLEAGDGVTVTLSYDITGAYYTEAGIDAGQPPTGYDVSSWYCAGAQNPAGPPCLAFHGFVPSVSKVNAPALDAGH